MTPAKASVSRMLDFVSAWAQTELDCLRGYELGAVDYLPVPVVPELLRAKVHIFAELYRKTRQLETLNAELERRVQERTAELAGANAELEQRVEERTRELADANPKLVAESLERRRMNARMQTLQSEYYHATRFSEAGQMSAALAHELSQPLTAALNSVSASGQARKSRRGARSYARRG